MELGKIWAANADENPERWFPEIATDEHLECAECHQTIAPGKVYWGRNDWKDPDVFCGRCVVLDQDCERLLIPVEVE